MNMPDAQNNQHQVLIDEFGELDRECQALIEKFSTGKIIYDCIPSDGAKNYEELFSKMVEKYMAAQEAAKQLVEKRNAKIQEIAAAMRGLVMAGENVVRGPDGKSTTLEYGPFSVSSKTSRSFDPELLFAKIAELGLLQRLKDVTFVSSDTGQSEPAIREVVEVKYEPVKNWLRENNLEAILDAAYEEEEGTPAVTGPKPIAWIGDIDPNPKKASKKGKK